MSDWIEIDGEPTPERDGVHVDAGGVALVVKGRRTRAGWDDVLGVTRVGDVVYVLVPRRPPQPPWIALDPTLGRDPAELVRDLRSRSERAGYRDVRAGRALLDPTELRARVLARDDVAGAVEVPGRFATPRPPYEALWAVSGASIGAAAGIAIAMAAHLEKPGMPAIVLTVAGMIGAVKAVRAWHRPVRPRLMVLAPDGLVASLDGAIRALPWREVARVERADHQGERGVRITTARGTEQWIDVRWLDAPADLVVAIAEAYRARWSGPAQRG